MSAAASWPAAAVALSRLGRRARLASAFAAGCLFALAQPPWGLWPLIFAALPALFWLWRTQRGAPAFWTGWAFGAGFFGLGMHWIVEPFLVDAPRDGWMAPFALVILAGGMALFPGAAAWAAARLRRGGDLHAAALLTLALFTAEALRSYILTGFPWALPAYVWVGAPPAQIAAHVGPYALSLLTLAFGLAPVVAAPRLRAAGALAAALCVGALWVHGEARLSASAPMTDTIVRIVQPNVAQRTKWDLDKVRAHLENHMELTAAAAEPRPDIVVWPESAVTFPLDRAPEAAAEIARTAGGADVAIGSLRVDDADSEGVEPRWRNSLFLLGEDGALSAPFDKIHLVPFGEYLPFDDLLNSLGVLAFAARPAGLVAGDAPVLMTPRSAPPFAPLICYEMIFPRETKAAAAGAAWMILATNDAWFGAGAGPVQHLAQARMRAIETGLPIARSANTGISAIIDAQGRITGRIAHGARGWIDRALPAPAAHAAYRDIGEVATLLIAMFLLLVAGFCARTGIRPDNAA